MWSYNNTYDSNELYHYGVKGMKWGVRKAEYRSMSRGQRKDQRRKYKEENGTFFRDKYGNHRKANPLFAPAVGMAKIASKGVESSGGNIRRSSDKMNIDYATKGMTPKQKKIFELNYYNDRKHVSRRNIEDSQYALDQLKKPNKNFGEKLAINLVGSDFVNRQNNMSMRQASEAYKEYSNAVDSLLKDVGDVKLKEVSSMRRVKIGDTRYTWLGTEYVEDK